MQSTAWYNEPTLKRAPKGGSVRFGKKYKGGQYTPFFVPRDVMPQIDEVFYPQLLDYAREQSVPVIERLIDPNLIKPHQRVNSDHTRHMDEETLAKPILSSREPFVLDGHHRWARHVHLHKPLKTYSFMLEFERAIAFLFTFPGTYYYGDGNDHPISR